MSRGRILIADDEPTFLASTAELLRREGFTVDTVEEGAAALAAISAAPYDLLITDLEMPGNADLDLVRQVAHVSGGLPIILITGFPSVRSAVMSIELPVTAYLVKPVHFPDLLARVTSAVARFRSYRVMQQAESRLRAHREQVDAVSPPLEGTAGVDTFLALTLRNVMGSLTDLEQLSRALAGQQVAQPHACQLINCPRGAQLQAAVEETIAVLEETKGAFKSKALGDLRHRLELLRKHV
ncbi:MAG: response regulator [Gemmatimonas sp.]|jgi:DNA-binding response OmpR family regulator|uniref:response regulator n=1 Tax=Gemmatimonas sp. TaxID=1962908 RepID=UPI00391F7ABE|nr:response regulator [Gemmatimonadota bacterium]